jgi:hypothetical protein
MALDLRKIAQRIAPTAVPQVNAPPAMPPNLPPQGLVPVGRPLAMKKPRVPPVLPARPLPPDGVVPVNRADAVRDVFARRHPLAASLLRASANNPAALQRMATIGGAVMGRGAANATQDARLAAASASTNADQRTLQQVVSERALPFLNKRRTGLLGY